MREPHVFWEDIWNAVHVTSQVTHGGKYMLANNNTEPDRVVIEFLHYRSIITLPVDNYITGRFITLPVDYYITGCNNRPGNVIVDR